MSPAVCGMYAGCSTPGEDWAAPEHDGQICTLLAAPQGDFHPPHHRAPLTPPVTERQWTPSQVSIRSLPTMFAKCRNVPPKCSNINYTVWVISWCWWCSWIVVVNVVIASDQWHCYGVIVLWRGEKMSTQENLDHILNNEKNWVVRIWSWFKTL